MKLLKIRNLKYKYFNQHLPFYYGVLLHLLLLKLAFPLLQFSHHLLKDLI